MNMSIRLLKMFSPKAEQQRMDLRRTIAKSEAHACDLVRSLENNFEEVAEKLGKVLSDNGSHRH